MEGNVEAREEEGRGGGKDEKEDPEGTTIRANCVVVIASAVSGLERGRTSDGPWMP